MLSHGVAPLEYLLSTIIASPCLKQNQVIKIIPIKKNFLKLFYLINKPDLNTLDLSRYVSS